jgi:drug/metabolite transporter (DMT)-like permease
MTYAPQHRPMLAVGLMTLSLWVLSVLDGTSKWLVMGGMPVLLVAWMRYTVHFGLALTIGVRRHGWGILRSKVPRLQLLRSALMIGSSLSVYTLLGYIPLAEATALGFVAPLIMLALAPWLLGESPQIYRWVGTAIAFAGMLLVIRPGGSLPPLGIALGLLNAVLIACVQLITKRMHVDNPFTTMIWSSMGGSILVTAMLPIAYSQLSADFMPTTTQWLALLSTGVTGLIGHLLQVNALQRGHASVIAPFIYLQIFSATFIGWLVWDQLPDNLTWVGISIIFLSGAMVGFIEYRKHRHGSRR